MRNKIISVIAVAGVIGWCALVARHVIRNLAGGGAADATDAAGEEVQDSPEG